MCFRTQKNRKIMIITHKRSIITIMHGYMLFPTTFFITINQYDTHQNFYLKFFFLIIIIYYNETQSKPIGMMKDTKINLKTRGSAAFLKLLGSSHTAALFPCRTTTDLINKIVNVRSSSLTLNSFNHNTLFY
jgi:hypothetical protein